MIDTLHIKNIGIISDMTISLRKGFNVLTGETGAGKTLIIDSLSILAGGRFSKEMIRRGEEYSFVEACIEIPNHKLAMDGVIILSREIHQNGKNLCKINGRMVTVGELKETMKTIIDIHGQQDNQILMDVHYHTSYMDKYIGKEIEEEKNSYQRMFEEYRKLKQELQENDGDEIEKQRKLDLLKYQAKEIEIAKLKKEEEENLEQRRKAMVNSEKLAENLIIVDQNLSENAIDAINTSIRALEKIDFIDKNYQQKLNELKSIYYEIQELARDVSGMKEDISFDEEERNEVESRLDLIFSLKRKYGNSISDILEYYEKVVQEITRIENLGEYHEKLRKQIGTLEKQMREKADKMTELRQSYGIDLADKINLELAQLEMPNARFVTKIVENKEFTEEGVSHIEFYIATNKGEEAKELIKIASGGEMSRIMLAIKTVLANVDDVPILVFDEIDTGISGKAAKVVGEKLKQIAKGHQVLCITHLATIAAKGDTNYYISKKIEGEQTATSIKQLNEEETIQEIARIANGDITEVAISHARELRKDIVA